MKVPKLTLVLLSLSLTILASSVACMLFIPEKPMIFTGDPEKEFLGIPWNCSFEELQKLLDQSPFPTKFKKVDVHADLFIYEYRGNHHLPYAKYSSFMFWRGKLSSISVFFSLESQYSAKFRFDELKKMMKKELAKLGGIEVMDFNTVRSFSGSKGQMSFELVYGGEQRDYSDRSVILSANTGISSKDK